MISDGPNGKNWQYLFTYFFVFERIDLKMKSITSKLPLFMQLNLTEKLNASFPYYLNDERKNILLSLGIGAFVTLFLAVYRPFQQFSIAHQFTFNQTLLYGGVTAFVLGLNILGLPRIFPRIFDVLFWTVKKHFLFLAWKCFLIGLACVFIDKMFICPLHTWTEIITRVYIQVALTGIIPITVTTLLLRNDLLQRNLESAIKANQELEKISVLKNEVSKPSSTLNQITIFSDTTDTVSLNMPDLLFVEADDNYSTIFWKNGGDIQKKMLRMNLKSVENQMDNLYTIRCHRSYIVNVHAISNVSGNTNGYKLKIRDSDFSIPVSRPKGKEVIEKIGQLRNMMELY